VHLLATNRALWATALWVTGEIIVRFDPTALRTKRTVTKTIGRLGVAGMEGRCLTACADRNNASFNVKSFTALTGSESSCRKT